MAIIHSVPEVGPQKEMSDWNRETMFVIRKAAQHEQLAYFQSQRVTE